MITFNNIVERFEIFAQNHFFIKTFSFGSPDDADLSKFTDFPLMHLVYTGANYDAGTKTYNIEVYILDVPADKNDKVERQKEVVSDAEQCAEDIIADIKNGGNIFLFAQDYEVVNATTTPLEEETKNVLSGVLLDLSVAIPYEWDACNAPIDGVEPGGTEVTYARRGVLRMLTIDGTTDVQSVRTINVTNGTLTDDGDGVVTLDTGGAETLNDLTDVDTTGVTDGQVLKYDNASGEWLPGNDQSATSLGNLDDVSIVTPANREALIYDGSEWVNDTVAKGDIGLGNVDNTSDADKPVSTATQTALNAKANTADVPTSLNDLSDVSIVGTPTGNQALIYDATANAFKSQVSYTNRFEDDVETGKQGITGTERAYSVKGEGDGVFADPESDTPAAGKVIVRKIYHKTGFITDADVIGDYTLIHTFADDTAYADTVATFEGFEDGATYGVPPFTLLQTWEEVAAAPTFTGLLNESYGSGAAAAYGTRRLNGNYSGACMTIRRASDGTTQAIGFVGEEIDESAITTFCTGTTCTVQVWHDQSQTGGTGSGNDATQTDSTKQPTIYTGGALVKEGGRLALDFDGADVLDAGSGFNLSTLSMITIQKSLDDGGTNAYVPISLVAGATQGLRQQIKRTSPPALRSRFDSTNLDFNTSNIYNQAIISSLYDGAIAYSYFNGGNVQSSSLTLSSLSSNSLRIGDAGSSGLPYKGKFQEAFLFDSSKSTSDRTSIEGNISAYYQSAKLLDESFGSGAEAAYSTRKLRRAQTDCMVIRRASDSTTQTIGFDANGNIDEAAINTFCSGTTCTVYQWIDQSGNGNTATAAAQANEPTIYTGGAIVKVDGKPAIRHKFGGTSNATMQASVSYSDSDLSIFCAYENDGTANQWLFEVDFNINLPDGVLMQSRSNELRLYRSSSHTSAVQAQNKNLGVHIWNGSNLSPYLNGVAGTVNTGSIGTTAFNFSTVEILSGIDVETPVHTSEIILYTSDKSSVRTSIESNIGGYFTQNTPLLDTYSGAAAAYSLRKLSSSYSGNAIRVRRSSDNTEQDIGFNVFGELNTVSLLDFAGAGDAFVKTWYSQTGSNDATQTTTASQPKIVSSGAVIVENGKPAVQFDGSNDFVATSDFTAEAQPFYFSIVATPSATTLARFIDTNGTVTNNRINITLNGTTYAINAGNSLAGGTTTTTQQLLTADFDTTNSFLYKDGVQIISGDAGTRNIDSVRIGANKDGIQSLNGTIQEVVFYNSDQSSNRTNIESNINTFYSIT